MTPQPDTRHLERQVEQWKTKAFDALAALKIANDNTEREADRAAQAEAEAALMKAEREAYRLRAEQAEAALRKADDALHAIPIHDDDRGSEAVRSDALDAIAAVLSAGDKP